MVLLIFEYSRFFSEFIEHVILIRNASYVLVFKIFIIFRKMPIFRNKKQCSYIPF